MGELTLSNQRKKVLFLTYGFSVGGAEMLLLNLLNGLNRERIEPIVVTLAKDGELEKGISEGIRLIRYARRFKLDFKPVVDIVRLVRRESINAIFALDLFTYLFVRLAVLVNHSRLKVLVSLHTTKPRSIRDYFLTLAYSSMLDKRTILVTVCNAQARYWSQKYSIPVQRFITVYNGVDADHWTPRPPGFDRSSARMELGIEQNAFVILQVATFRPEKGHLNSIQALSILHRTTSMKPYLLFVGGGNIQMENRLRSVTTSFSLDKYVIFSGQHSDIRRFY